MFDLTDIGIYLRIKAYFQPIGNSAIFATQISYFHLAAKAKFSPTTLSVPIEKENKAPSNIGQTNSPPTVWPLSSRGPLSSIHTLLTMP